ncbi:MAG TPA: hypothetical protein VG013_28575 [Gemmataceae bacterium]|jgi:hypothetical protein|nr:hypothetical protein [Gemmataceae bacterium]
MAKYCDVCKQPYPDDQPVCPHCAAAAPAGAEHESRPSAPADAGGPPHQKRPGDSTAEIHLARPTAATTDDSGIILAGPGAAAGDFDEVQGSSLDIDLDRPAAGPGADSGVVLGEPAASGPSSDVVDLDWSALVEDEPAPARPAESEVLEAMEATPPPAAQPPPPATADTGPKATQLAPRSKPETMLAPSEAQAAEPPPEPPSKQTMLAKDDDALVVRGATTDEDPSAVDLLHQPVSPDSDSGEAQLAEVDERSGPPELAEPAEEAVSDVEPGGDDEDVFVPEDSSDVLGDAGLGRPSSVSALEIDEAAMEAAQPRRPAAHAEPSSETLARQLLDDDETAPAGEDRASGVSLGAESEVDEEDVATARPPSDVDLGGMEGETATAEAEAGEAEEEAVAEGEAEDEAREEDEEAPKKPAKRRGRATPWVGGGVVGLLVGTAACIGLWAFGVEPPQSLKMVKKEAAKSAAPPQPGTGAQVHKEPEQTARDRFYAWLGQRKPGQGPVKDTEAAVQDAMNEVANVQDADSVFNKGLIQESVGDIAKARQTYQQGLAQFKDAPDQRRFEAALDRLDTRSDAATANAPDGKPPTNRPGGKSTSARPLPEARGRFDAALVGLFLPVVAAGAPAPAAGAEADEAGFDFWKALKLANVQHKYSDAIALLEKARATHQQQRFLRRNKAQNPASDPTDEIFLRCADELRAYWQLRSRLSDVTKQQNPAKALEKLLDNGKAMEAVAAELKNDKTVAAADPELQNLGPDVQLVLEAKKKAEDQLAPVTTALEKAKVLKAGDKDLTAGVQKLVGEWKQATEALAAAHDILEREKAIGAGDAGVAAGITKLLAAKKTTDTELRTTTAQLKAQRATVAAIAAKLTAAKVLPAGAEQAQLFKAVDRLVKEGSSPVVTALADLAGGLSRLGGEAADRTARVFNLSNELAGTRMLVIRSQLLLAHAHTPDQMLNLWASLLRGGRHQELAEAAATDAQRVLTDRGSGAQARAAARAVEGLALRSQGKFVEARAALEQAVKEPAAPRAAAWHAAGQATLKDLTDPEAYFLPQAEKLWAAGQPEEALVMLNTGLDAFPDKTRERGRLLARRSLVQLNMARARARTADREDSEVDLLFARSTGRPLRADAVAAAEKDAQAAVAAGAAPEGQYALGQIAEAVGRSAKAAGYYRQALKAADSTVEDQNRCRLALAQVLIRLSDGQRPAAPEQKPAGARDTKPRRAPAPRKGSRAQHARQASAAAAALVAVLLAGEDVGRPSSGADDLKDARGLAEDAIRHGDPAGHLVLAQVLAREDRWTVALMEYIEGMRQLTKPPEIAQGLQDLVAHHPAFKIPDSLRPPQPLLAEERYSEGLRLYWGSRYPAAEKEFSEAVRYNGDDARYSYFLGLAWLQQGRRAEALEAFRQGGVLEKQGMPDPATVNTALERVQGSRRRLIDEYRR